MYICKQRFGTRGGVTGKCTWSLTGEHIFIQLCERDAEYVGNQMGMHTCIDACTHSDQGLGQEKRLHKDVQWATQMHTCLHATMQMGLSRHGESVGHE